MRETQKGKGLGLSNATFVIRGRAGGAKWPRLGPDQRQTGFPINLFLKVDRTLRQYDLTGRADMCLD